MCLRYICSRFLNIKTIFLDVGILQVLLGLDLTAWFLSSDKDLVHRGTIAEAFVGQELLAYASPYSKSELYFWKRESKGALAEIDYVCDFRGTVLPIEVKSGHGSTLRSMHQFLEEHPKFSPGLRFWSESYSMLNKIDSRPLYAVATLAHQAQMEALKSLF